MGRLSVDVAEVGGIVAAAVVLHDALAAAGVDERALLRARTLWPALADSR